MNTRNRHHATRHLRALGIISMVFFMLFTTRALAQKQNEHLSTGSLNTNGLYNVDMLNNLYTGNFLDIRFDRDNIRFISLYSSYLNSYAGLCSRHLPQNKIEMTTQKCTQEWVTTNGYGVEISRSCSQWVTVGTGLYAEPAMYQAKLKLERIQAGDSFRQIFGIINQDNPIAGAMDMVRYTQTAKQDMDALIQLNSCQSPELKRFQENLRLFALNDQPIGMASAASGASKRSTSDAPAKDQDFNRMMEDLISNQSKSWVMNRFIIGSVSGISVTSRDPKGYPSSIEAQYLFKGFRDRSRGSVTVTFKDGMPDCMYFFDFPRTCRTPDRRIVAAYAKGKYAN